MDITVGQYSPNGLVFITLSDTPTMHTTVGLQPDEALLLARHIHDTLEDNDVPD